MSIDTKALIAATPATVALVRRELDKSREAQRGGCSIPKAVKVDCAMVERLCRLAEKQADRLAALDAAFDLMQEQDGWIPVSERLPPEGVDVLVLSDYGQIVGSPAHRDCGKRYGYKIAQRYGELFTDDFLETGQATHWMPLPEAPQPEEAL